MKTETDPARRRALLALGAAVVAGPGRSLAAESPPACVLTAEQTEGPYFIDHRLERSDLRRDARTGTLQEGVPLSLALRLHAMRGNDCGPLAGAVVHLWHCDAAGVYSGVERDAAGNRFLRGFQVSDAQGVVRFHTIYPGWYPGRTVHLHFKVQLRDAAGRRQELTSQLYFDDAVTDRVMSMAPYAARGPRDRGNRTDGLYRHGGRGLMLTLVEQGQGYAGTFDVGVKLA